MGEYTGTVPTFLAGELPDADKFTEITNFMTAATAAWSVWVPALTNLTLGNGTVTARYRRLGKTVDYHFKFVLGSTSAVGTQPAFTLPVSAHSSYSTFQDIIGMADLADPGVANRTGMVRWDGGKAVIFAFNTTGVQVDVTATVPHTWGVGDSLSVSGTYEAA